MPHPDRTVPPVPEPARAGSVPSVPDVDPAPESEPLLPVRVVLFGRAGCHLCDDARQVVRDVCAATGESWVEIDIDAPESWALVGSLAAPGEPGGAAGSSASPAEYSELVPVVEVDGVRQGYWLIDAERLTAALAVRPSTL